MGTKQKPLMIDVGIIFSDNIVATDQASLDLVNKHSKGRFERINDVDNSNQIRCAEKLKLGEKDYQLITI